MPDYESDPRPLSVLLKDYAARLNGGEVYGARAVAASALRVSPGTLAHWMDGRGCSLEASVRRLMSMTLADRLKSTAASRDLKG